MAHLGTQCFPRLRSLRLNHLGSKGEKYDT